MAADVSYLLRALTGYKDDRTVANNPVAGKSTAMVTRDLLGGGASSRDDSQELDLDLQVPSGWEKRLDLKVLPFSLMARCLFPQTIIRRNEVFSCILFFKFEIFSS